MATFDFDNKYKKEAEDRLFWVILKHFLRL